MRRASRSLPWWLGGVICLALGAAGCDGDLAGLEHACATLAVRRDQARALVAEIDADPGEMSRLIADANGLRAHDPAFDAESLVARLERVAPGVTVARSARYLWISGRGPFTRGALALTAVAAAAPHLTADHLFVGDREWRLDLMLPEVALPGAYAEAAVDELAIPDAPFWQSRIAQLRRREIFALQLEIAGYRERAGALMGLPALRKRLASDRRTLAFGSRLDRALLLITNLFGGERPTLATGFLTFVGDQVQLSAVLGEQKGAADLLIAVPTAELPGGDLGWNLDEVHSETGGHLRGQLAWRARPPRR